jgi:uncharacterized DUF497 family protein
MKIDIKSFWQIHKMHGLSFEEVGKLVQKTIVQELKNYDASVEYPYKIPQSFNGRDVYMVLHEDREGEFQELDGTVIDLEKERQIRGDIGYDIVEAEKESDV